MKIYRISRSAPYRSFIVDKVIASGLALPHAEVLGALRVLQHMGEVGIGDNADYMAYYTTLGGNAKFPNPALYNVYLSYIAFLYDNIRMPEVGMVLGHLARAAQIVRSAPTSPAAVMYSDIKADLDLILSYFGGRTTTTKTEQHPMFLKLFNEFSQQIGNAASNMHKTSLANAVSRNALLNPSSMAQATKLSKPEPRMFVVVNKLIDDIFRNKHDDRFFKENFEVIKETLMRNFGFISAEQRKEVRRNRQEQEFAGSDPMAGAPGSPIPPPIQVSQPYNVGDEQWINPGFLSSIMIFFNQYNNRIMKLPT